MTSIERSTVTISTAAAIFIAIIGVGGGIVGNYYATRSAVQLELNQIKNDLRYEVAELKNADAILNMRVEANKIAIDAVNTHVSGLKPEEQKLKRFR